MSLRSRLKPLERALGRDWEAEIRAREQTRRVLLMLGEAALSHMERKHPGIEHVIAEDTDRITLGRIEHCRALAAGDLVRAAELDDAPKPPAALSALERIRWLGEHLLARRADRTAEERKLAAAASHARKRLGLTQNDMDPMPVPPSPRRPHASTAGDGPFWRLGTRDTVGDSGEEQCPSETEQQAQ